MSDKTKRELARNFLVNGALRRGLVWVMVCWVVAYFPQMAQAFQSIDRIVG
jgi:hypothetical protein